VPRKKTTTLSIPKELADEVAEFIRTNKLGYVGVSEYAREAIRLKLLLDKGRLKIKESQ